MNYDESFITRRSIASEDYVASLKFSDFCFNFRQMSICSITIARFPTANLRFLIANVNLNKDSEGFKGF